MKLGGFEYGCKENTKILENGDLLIRKTETFFIIFVDGNKEYMVDSLEAAKEYERINRGQRLKDSGALEFFKELARKEVRFEIKEKKLFLIKSPSSNVEKYCITI